MGGLDISEVTIGYSSTGAAKYVDELNTAAINETKNIIDNGVSNMTNVFQTGWQGNACESFIKKLNDSCNDLKEKLSEMQALFEATLAAQEESYHQEDQSMSEDITNMSVF